jgi:hypothetical protein
MEVSIAADIWSFGVLLTDLLFPSRSSPWEGCLDKKGKKVDGTMYFLPYIDDGGLPILTLGESESKLPYVIGFHSIIRQCLITNAESRWDIDRVTQALEEINEKI